ncbi:MAG: hypothetical protein Q9217_005657 [Psora testacea]
MKRHTNQQVSPELGKASHRFKFIKQEASPDTHLSRVPTSEMLDDPGMPGIQSAHANLVIRERPIKLESKSPDLHLLHKLDESSPSPCTSKDISNSSHLTRTTSASVTRDVSPNWLEDRLSFNSKAYKDAARRLLIFDYDGTLTPIVENPAAAILTEAGIHALNLLASHPKNSVWIVSGRNQNFLAEQFAYSPRIGLAAEHGAFIRQPGKPQWANLAQNVDLTWKKPVKQVFKGLCEMIPESRIEEKKAAMVWHYRANQDDGEVMAPACRKLLEQRAQRLGWAAHVTAGKCVIEVRPDTINKGHIVHELVERLKAADNHFPEFVFCVGDDHTDEDMFTAVAHSELPYEYNFCTRIGHEGTTKAVYQLSSPEDLYRIIWKFNECEQTGEWSPVKSSWP